jgi:hypothetical protein
MNHMLEGLLKWKRMSRELISLETCNTGKYMVACILICMFLFSVSADAGSLLQTGRYVRVTKSPLFLEGGREFGELNIKSVRKARADFQLEVTWNPKVDDDGYLTNNGVIDDGVITVNGAVGRYVSANPEDKELGKCILDFTFKGNEIVMTQKGKCWWFGENVDATGVYRRAKGDEAGIVK